MPSMPYVLSLKYTTGYTSEKVFYLSQIQSTCQIKRQLLPYRSNERYVLFSAVIIYDKKSRPVLRLRVIYHRLILAKKEFVRFTFNCRPAPSGSSPRTNSPHLIRGVLLTCRSKYGKNAELLTETHSIQLDVLNWRLGGIMAALHSEKCLDR